MKFESGLFFTQVDENLFLKSTASEDTWAVCDSWRSCYSLFKLYLSMN